MATFVKVNRVVTTGPDAGVKPMWLNVNQIEFLDGPVASAPKTGWASKVGSRAHMLSRSVYLLEEAPEDILSDKVHAFHNTKMVI